MNSSIIFSLMKWIWISMCLISAWNWKFLIKTITFWLFSYIIIAWEYSTSHVNWVIKFRNQMTFFAIKIYLVYSISQINNVTMNCRLENQLMTSLSTLNTYFKLIVWCLDFLLNSNSCNFLKILMLRETLISFNVFLVNSENCVWSFFNVFEWNWKHNDWSSR
jgi:hypothetical protein